MSVGGAGGEVDPGPLPPNGTAQYRGTMIVGLPQGPNSAVVRHTGVLRLDVNFSGAADQVTGRADGFAVGVEPALTGTLFLTRGAFDPDTPATDPTYAGLISGALQRGTDAHTLHGRFSGAFQGDDTQTTTGMVTGTAVQRGVATTFDGAFSGDKQP